MKQPQKIESQEMLDALIKKKTKKNIPLECFIQLRFGIRSSKLISLNENRDYCICHECDDTEEIVNHDNLQDTFIGKAIQGGAFYKY